MSVDEVEKTKQRMLAGLVYLRDNPEDAAYIAGAMTVAGVSWEEIENQENAIKQVTYKDVLKAARVLQNSPQVTGILEPEKGENR